MTFLPAYAGIRFAAEHSDTDPDLMFITTIRPRSIIWGKMLSTGLLAVLIYAACMPFMTLTWLMRGVDLPTIFLVILIGFCVVATTIQLAIFCAALTTNRGFRVLLGLGLLACIIAATGTTIGQSVGLVYFGSIAEDMYWRTIGLVVFFTACHVAVLQACSIALISPPSSNRAPIVRVTVSIVMLATGAVAFTLAWIETKDEILIAWAVAWAALFAFAMAVSVCERERLGNRVARTIRRNFFARRIAYLFYSGAGAGVLWCWLMLGIIVAVLGVAQAISSSPRNDYPEGYIHVIGYGLYGYCYAMTALLIRRYLLGRFVRPEHTWALVLVLVAIGCTLPALPAYMMFKNNMWSENGAMGYWLAPNPTALSVSETTRAVAFWFITPWALAVTALATPWFLAQIQRFRRPDPT